MWNSNSLCLSGFCAKATLLSLSASHWSPFIWSSTGNPLSLLISEFSRRLPPPANNSSSQTPANGTCQRTVFFGRCILLQHRLCKSFEVRQLGKAEMMKTFKGLDKQRTLQKMVEVFFFSQIKPPARHLWCQTKHRQALFTSSQILFLLHVTLVPARRYHCEFKFNISLQTSTCA